MTGETWAARSRGEDGSDVGRQMMMKKGKNYRLAILQTHPIQYHAPFYRGLSQAERLDVTVFYGSRRYGCEPAYDEGFGVNIQWDVPLLSGYRAVFLRNISPCPSVNKRWGLLPLGLYRKLRAGHFDAVLLNGYSLLYFWLAMICAKALGLPVMLRAETTTLRRSQANASKVRHAAKSLLCRFFLANVDAFLPIGSLSKEFYRGYGVPEEKLFLAPYCVDNRFFEQQMQASWGARKRIRAEVGTVDEVVGICVAKLIPRKRPMDLLAAYARMRNRERLSLIFVGDGELRSEIERFVRLRGLSKVRVVGFKNQTELSQYYMAADFAVLPSAIESWGLAINEALVHSLPVVATDMVSGAYDLIEEGKTGWRYPAGNVEELARILDDIVATPEKCREMGRVARKLVANYSIPVCVEAVERALEFVARRRT